MTGLNKDICWCACYSDDRSPIGGASNLINGSFQKALDDSYNFMKSQQCYYHLEGKKRPKMLVFENSKTKLKADVNNIKLGDTKIEISTKEKILGMHMATKSTRPLSKSLIKKYTYVLEPDIGKFQSIANNFYFVKNDFNPTMRKLCIQSYFIGTVNYCWSLYWLRSSIADIRKVRFYYMCCLGSILGFSIDETVGAGCLCNQSVSESNEKFVKLINFVGMPSLRDIACLLYTSPSPRD